MSYSWFRFYHEFSSDPKIQMLSEADQRRFVMLLCLRCSNGDVTLQDNQIAFQLRISEEEWLQSKKTFLHKKLINEHGQPLNWDKRQMKSDHSNQRVEKYRKRYSNGPDQTRPDSDTDKDHNQKNGHGSFASMNGLDGFRPSLETADKLFSVAPGWDQHALIEKYNAWQNGKERPRNPDAAFLGWAKSFTKGRRP